MLNKMFQFLIGKVQQKIECKFSEEPIVSIPHR